MPLKNSLNNISKTNPEICKNNISYPHWVYPKNEGLTFENKLMQFTILDQREKSFDNFNRCRKTILQNYAPIHVKNSLKSRNVRELPQFDEGHLQKPYSYYQSKQ